MTEEQVLDILVALHEFCATMTKEQFIDEIGHGSTWDKVVFANCPNVYDLLSYGDLQTRANLANWLIRKTAERKE